MKKIKIIGRLLLLFSVFTFTSCENEPLDPAIDLNPIIEPTCVQPSALQASSFIADSNVNLSWSAGDNESMWEIQYGLQGFSLGSGTIISSSNTNYIIEGLSSSNSYQFYVRSKCSVNSSSAWIGPVLVQSNVNNTSCLAPTNLTATRGTSVNTTVNLSWSAGSNEASWEVQYGLAGFSIGNGTIVTSNANTKSLSNLTIANSYDFYVRAKCSATQFSSWIGPINIPTVSTALPIIGYMNANIKGIQYNQMKPTFYTITGLPIGVDVVSIDTGEIRTIRVQGNSDPFFTTTSGVEINLFISQQYWQTGTFVLKSAIDVNNTSGQYPYVDLIIQETGPVIYEQEITGTITITEFSQTTKRIQGTFSFNYMTSDGNGNLSGPFTVINGEFGFTLKDEVFN